MRFRFMDAATKEFPVHHLRQVLGVIPSGYFAWEARPARHRQHTDLMRLAHVRAAFAVSTGTYGSPPHGARAPQRRLADRASARCPPDAP